jgi:hypothetical protein
MLLDLIESAYFAARERHRGAHQHRPSFAFRPKEW